MSWTLRCWQNATAAQPQRNRSEYDRLLQRHGLTPDLFRGDGPEVEQ
jgi:hypothetical protein